MGYRPGQRVRQGARHGPAGPGVRGCCGHDLRRGRGAAPVDGRDRELPGSDRSRRDHRDHRGPA